MRNCFAGFWQACENTWLSESLEACSTLASRRKEAPQGGSNGGDMDTEYLETAKREVRQWESQRPGFLLHLGDFLLVPAEKAVRAIVPAAVQDAVALRIQGVLSGVSSTTRLLVDEDKVHREVELACSQWGDELRAADTVAKQCWNRNVALAIAQGGSTGALGLAGLAADVPALLTISLRLIRRIGACYGYGYASDVEQEYVMHVLRVGSTSSLKAKMEFLGGLKQVEQILLSVSWRKMNESLARREISRISLLAALRHFAEKLGVQLTKRKALQSVPVIGAMIGASFNGLFVNDVGRSAYMLYRRRRIAHLEGPTIATSEGWGGLEVVD